MWLRRPVLEEWYLRQLSASDPETRRHAALELSEMKSRRALPVLLGMLEAEAAESRTVTFDGHQHQTFVRESLAKLGTLSAERLFDAFSIVEEKALIDYIAETLGDMGQTGASFLWKALELPRAPARIAAMCALWRVERAGTDWERFISRASTLLTDDESAEVRNAAANVLDGMGPAAARALPALSRANQDPAGEVRTSAAWAVFHILRSADAYIQALESQDRYLIEYAIRMLDFDPRDKESIPILMKHLSSEESSDETQEWKKFATYALRRFHGKTTES